MSEAEQRRERVRQRIAASQGRLERESGDLPAVPRREPLTAAQQPSEFATAVKNNPMLSLAAGVGIGLLIGALVPKNAGGKTGRRVLALAGAAAELGLALGKQAADKASDAGRQGVARLEEGTAPLRQRAGRAGNAARSRGIKLAGKAIKIAAKLRK